MTTCNTTKAEAESESKDARTNQHLSKFAKITEGIMTSHGCFLCLLLLSVIPIEPSEAGCMDHFTKKGWKANASSELPENIPVKIMNKSEDIIVCSLMEAEDCDNKKENTCFLRECFKDENNMDYKPPCNEADENISVPFYHFMCLTNIAKHLRDKTNGGSQKPTAEDVCKVYEKVCKRDSPNPETLQGESAEKKERILHIIIGVLTFTNFLWVAAFYMYTQRLQRSNERNTFRSDIGEGSILLMTPESSIIINSPETTIIESPCPHRTHL
ncbi:uncharacterized protein LOC120736874 isoform X2 [Simochromis diagramma]|uniref:uncharacterized protein LOC120736874 isoform X2 n=1 Tax=Simochromis diagramma TaxID=43689 RepID=UPI001A7EB028|nr:uncharacterized protein LOC120736874 isoform X2 [Simochromis diagramma]